MKAVLLFHSRRLFGTSTGKTVVMEMDLYELPSKSAGRYRFSWIAFDQEDPSMRVLFDCHPPKGPHFHVDGDEEGRAFAWSSISAAIQLFREKTTERFGELKEISDAGGQDE